MSLRKEKDMKKKRNKLTQSAKKQEVDLKLKRPFLTGMMVAIGLGIGGAVVSLLTLATTMLIPIAYMYIKGLMG
jgi:hypothetical protein